MKRILIGGVGDKLRADDGFGIEVVRQLSRNAIPAEVEIRDFGIRAFELTSAILERKHDLIYLVGSARRGDLPGTLYLLQPEVADVGPEEAQDQLARSQGLDTPRVLAWIRACGGRIDHVRIVGCEPDDLIPGKRGLSAAVFASVEPAVRLLQDEIERARAIRAA